MSDISTIRAAVLSIVKTEYTVSGQIDTTAGGDVDTAILAALRQHEHVRPREVVVAKTGNGGFDYSLTAASPIVADWKRGLSDVTELIFPYDATVQAPIPLDDDEFAVIELPAGIYLRFRAAKPAATQQFLMTYTTAHVLSSTQSTVPEVEEIPLAQLGAAHVFRKLAGLTANVIDGAIQADSVQRTTKSEIFLRLASQHEKTWRALMGGDESAPVGRGLAVESDPRFANPIGSRLFFHDTRGH